MQNSKFAHSNQHSKKKSPGARHGFGWWCAAGIAGLSVLVGDLSLRESAVQAAPYMALAIPYQGPAPVSDLSRLAMAERLLVQAPDQAERAFSELFVEVADKKVLSVVASRLVQLQDLSWPTDFRGQFLRSLAPQGLLAGRETGVPPSVTLAQAILESGWGRSNLARTSHNLFGIKGAGGYKRYADWTASLRDHDALLAEGDRYAAARRNVGDWRAFLSAMAPVYATSRSYVAQISGLVEDYELDRWDALVHAAAESARSPDVHEDGVVDSDPDEARR